MRLSDLPQGSTFRLLGRVTDRDVDVLSPDGTSLGAVVKLPPETDVEAVAVHLTVGDVVREVATGDTRVVMWVDEDGQEWSSSTGTQPRMAFEGWVRVPPATP